MTSSTTVRPDQATNVDPQETTAINEAFGLVGVGGTTFAVPADMMVEAVDAPVEYTRLPQSPQRLRGFFQLRDETVAVLDMHGLLGLETPDTPPAHVLLLQYQNVRYAIAVDRIGSVERMRPEALITLALAPAPDRSPEQVPAPASPRIALPLFPRVLVDNAIGGIIGVLDMAALATTPGVVAIPHRRGARDSGNNAGQTAQVEMRQRAIVRCGTCLVALSADAIQSVSEMPSLSQPLPDSTHFLGIAKWRGADLPVMALASVTLLPNATTGAQAYLMVVESNGIRAGFPVDELVELTPLHACAQEPVPANAFARPQLFLGSTRTANGAHALVIDADALMASPAVVKLAPSAQSVIAPLETLDKDVPEVEAGSSVVPSGGYLVFSAAGGTFAARLEQIVEIFEYPEKTVRTRMGHASMGLVEWQDSLIELVDIGVAHQLRSPETDRRRTPTESPAGRCAIVIRQDRLAHALAIDAVLSLSGIGEPAEVAMIRNGNDGLLKQVVTLGTQAARRTYALIDLYGEMARA